MIETAIETALFDSNVLVYMHDASAPYKQEIARAVFERYAAERKAALSTQVLQEFFVTITSKLARLSVPVAGRLVASYARLNVVILEPRHILDAIGIHSRFQVSFWDGLILAAAKSAGASVLFTEDLSDGQVYDGVRAENPFRRGLQ